MGANFNKRNRDGKSIFELCNSQNQFVETAKALNPESVKEYLEMASMFVDVNKPDSGGWTALTYATVKGNITMINYLLSIGAHPDVSTTNSSYPIHYAAAWQHLIIMQKDKQVMPSSKYSEHAGANLIKKTAMAKLFLNYVILRISSWRQLKH